MLKLCYKLHQLSFSRLMEVYLEGNLEKADFSRGESLLRAEQDFYTYLDRVFFRTEGSVYAIWEEGGRYLSALRLEPYRDGLLLEGLETAPDSRRLGYGRCLVTAVQQQFSEKKIYSHIARDNRASRSLHEALGFRKIADHSLYIDGSVNDRCATYLWTKETAIG